MVAGRRRSRRVPPGALDHPCRGLGAAHHFADAARDHFPAGRSPCPSEAGDIESPRLNIGRELLARQQERRRESVACPLNIDWRQVATVNGVMADLMRARELDPRLAALLAHQHERCLSRSHPAHIEVMIPNYTQTQTRRHVECRHGPVDAQFRTDQTGREITPGEG